MTEIEKARRMVNMSRRSVSEWLEIPYGTLTKWETGERPCPRYVEKLIVEKILSKERKNSMRYEIRKNVREVQRKDRFEIKAGCTLNQDDQEPEIIKPLTDLQDALQKLAEYKSSITDHGSFFTIEEYYVEQNEYDEDGDWVSGGEVIKVSEFKISLVEKKNYEEIRSFNNMRDAEEALEEYDGEAYLSYI